MTVRRTLLRLGFPLALAMSWALTAPDSSAGQSAQPELRWYKGNLHTHTLNSDGDSTPDEVVRWYRDHKYNFLVLTDHNFLTDPQPLNGLFAAKERFLLLAGEEVTSRMGKKPIHVNAFDIQETIPPLFGATVVETIQKNVDAIHSARGIASLNHPNFGWAVTPEELTQVNGLRFFEVYNGHPTVHNEGGGGSMSLDGMWDVALTAGRELYGIAVDDAHTFKAFGPQYSNPGRGWIAVQAESLSASAIRGALERGEFYASNGVELAEVVRTAESLKIRIEPRESFKYTIDFIGSGGAPLARSYDLQSAYTLKPSDRYVRARVTDSMGNRAWTQPVMNPR